MSKDGNKKVRAEDLPYRPCVGIMVLNAKGLVWAGRRISEGNSEYDGSPQLWQMPQGGIDPGEDPETASLRELYEETGMKSVSLLAEASRWINYDLPEKLIGVGLKGKYRGQTQRWFAYRFEGDESEIAINRMVTYIEPAMIVFMAVIVGFVMISVLMPIYGSYQVIGAEA